MPKMVVTQLVFNELKKYQLFKKASELQSLPKDVKATDFLFTELLIRLKKN